jgi:hypothetical protein
MDKNFRDIFELSNQINNNILKYYYRFIISWIYFGRKSKNYKNYLDEILIGFLKFASISNGKEKESLLSNFTSIFYHLILTQYENLDILSDYFNLIIFSLKNNNQNQLRNFFRINLIFEILKLKYNDFYSIFSNKIKELERIIILVNEEEGLKRKSELKNQIWWDRDYFNKNIYSKNFIYEYIKSKNISTNLEFFPVINNIHFCEFKINDKKYLEFIGPFQINNYFDDFPNKEKNYELLNCRYKLKKEIFENYGLELIQIDYNHILRDIKNIDKYLI